MPESKSYQIGDIIGHNYEVLGVVGKGGFGVVYLVYSREAEYALALKTFRDEYLEDSEARTLFRKEAQVWVDLERHPYLVRAYFVDEISGRLYIAMEYIAPVESSPNALQGYLDRRPPDLSQSLRWAIQFCYGMEYAYSKGIRCHRDIKPANIMISQDKTVKISDFGLAGVLGASKLTSAIRLNIQEDKVGLSMHTIAGQGLGTPTHMPPEQFYDISYCDQRSDIYSFGIVLFQMASGGKLPFLPVLPKDNSQGGHLRFWQEIQRLHEQAPVPKLSTPLFPIIQRCLEKMPDKRYTSFYELRSDLEPLLKQKTGEIIRIPAGKKVETWDLCLKGVSLISLGRYDEAIRLFDKALELDPRDAEVWTNKGLSLFKLGRKDEAIRCFDKAIEIDPRVAEAWNNKGTILNELGRYDDAIRCLDKAILLDSRDAGIWANKGRSFFSLGRKDEALRCFDKAIEIDSRFAGAWVNKGKFLNMLGRYDEGIQCLDKAILLDPKNANAWHNKGISLFHLGHKDEAVRCIDKVIELDPCAANAWYEKGAGLGKTGRHDEAISCFEKVIELDPQHALAWNYKGVSLASLGRYEEAIWCCERALELDPHNEIAWNSKGAILLALGRHDETIQCCDKAIELNPELTNIWFLKASTEDALARKKDAVHSYKQFLSLATAQDANQIAHARQRLKELEGKS